MPEPDMLRTFLADRDTPCPGCGYNLRGLPADRCPECNQQLILRLGLAEPRLGLFLTGLIGLAAGLAFYGFLLVAQLVTWAARGFSMPPSAWWPLLIGVGTLAPLTVAWARCRRRLGRLQAGKYRLLAAGCWGLSIGVTVVLVLVVP